MTRGVEIGERRGERRKGLVVVVVGVIVGEERSGELGRMCVWKHVCGTRQLTSFSLHSLPFCLISTAIIPSLSPGCGVFGGVGWISILSVCACVC